MKLNRSAFFKWAAAGVVAAGALLVGASANAGVSWSVGVSTPGIVLGVGEPAYYPPAPVYYAPPPPVYYQPPAPVYYRPPPPVYYRPAPIYYRPAPGYYRPAPGYYRGGRGHGEHWRGNRRGHDRDDD